MKLVIKGLSLLVCVVCLFGVVGCSCSGGQRDSDPAGRDTNVTVQEELMIEKSNNADLCN